MLKEPTDIQIQSTDFQYQNLFDSFGLAAPAVTPAEHIETPVIITVIGVLAFVCLSDKDKRKNSNPLVELD